MAIFDVEIRWRTDRSSFKYHEADNVDTSSPALGVYYGPPFKVWRYIPWDSISQVIISEKTIDARMGYPDPSLP